MPLCFQTAPQETGGWKEIGIGFCILSSLPLLNHRSFFVWMRSLCLLWAHLLGKLETKFCWMLLWGALGSHIHHCVQARPWGAQGFEPCASGWQCSAHSCSSSEPHGRNPCTCPSLGAPLSTAGCPMRRLPVHLRPHQ